VSSTTPPRPRRTRLLAATAVTLLLADLVTKILAVGLLTGRSVRTLGGLVYLTEARNSGAAFSFAEGATVLFTAVATVVITVIVRTAPRLRSAPWAVCLGLILGGAGGNLVDRLFRSPGPLRGAVIDWISLLDPYGNVWPIFNLADSGIVCGGVLAVLLAMLGYEVDGSRHREARSAGDRTDALPPGGDPAALPEAAPGRPDPDHAGPQEAGP
jgi:signal peptidase II